jgi:hypothetical protein
MVCRSKNNKINWLLYKGFQCLKIKLFFEATIRRGVSLLVIKTRALFTQHQILVRLPNIN